MKEYRTKKQKKRFYDSSEWKSLRSRILQEQNYECQECKKLGYVNIRNQTKRKSLDVDHIKEIYTHPELALEPTNLRVLCIPHHNEKHGRKFKKKSNKWDGDERW